MPRSKVRPKAAAKKRQRVRRRMAFRGALNALERQGKERAAAEEAVDVEDMARRWVDGKAGGGDNNGAGGRDHSA